MLRTLADALAAAATRRIDGRKRAIAASRLSSMRLDSNRLGIERLETRNLLSASAGAPPEWYSWHFEDGPADRHAAGEPPAAVFRGGYEDQGAGNYGAHDFGQQFAPPRGDAFGDRYAPLRSDAPPSGRPGGVSSAPVSSYDYVVIVYVMQWDAPPPPSSPPPLKAMAFPGGGNVGGGALSGIDGELTQVGQGADPKSANALSQEGTPLPDESSRENYFVDSSVGVVLQLDGVTSAVAMTQGADEATTLDKSRLLQALESHDTVFQALAAQTSSQRLRGASSWFDAGASSAGLSRVTVVSQRGIDSHDDEQVSESSKLESVSDAAGEHATRWQTNIESNADGVHSRRRSGRRAANDAQDADELVADGTPTPSNEATANGDEAAAAQDEGGMVLLRTPGAENGVDAIDAAMARLEHGDARGATIDMEAGIGMYRAFNVGAGESAADPSVQSPATSTAAPTEAAREGVDAPRSASGAQMAAIAAGAVVMGAWGAKSRAKANDDRRPTSRVPQ